jgi:hypothetical protein
MRKSADIVFKIEIFMPLKFVTDIAFAKILKMLGFKVYLEKISLENHFIVAH